MEKNIVVEIKINKFKAMVYRLDPLNRELMNWRPDQRKFS